MTSNAEILPQSQEQQEMSQDKDINLNDEEQTNMKNDTICHSPHQANEGHDVDDIITQLSSLALTKAKQQNEDEKPWPIKSFEITSSALRSYQKEVVDKAWQHTLSKERCLVQLPTGGGKSIIITTLALQAIAVKQWKVCILVHKEDLFEQQLASLERWGVPLDKIGFLKAGKDDSLASTSPLVLASIQTFHSRVISGKGKPIQNLQNFDLVLIDEAHHVVSSTFTSLLKWVGKGARVIGFTATPFRTKSNEHLDKVFSRCVDGPSITWLVSKGYLVPPLVFPSSKSACMVDSDVARLRSSLKSAVLRWKSKANNLPTLGFCVDLDHAQKLAEMFQAHGIKAERIDGNMPPEKRVGLIRDSKEGEIKVLCSVDLLGEGSDLPWIRCLLLMRPTQSRSLFVQQVGRGLRPFEGKTHCIVLDEVGNSWSHGALHSFNKKHIELMGENKDEICVMRARDRGSWESDGLQKSAVSSRIFVGEDSTLPNLGKPLIRRCGEDRELGNRCVVLVKNIPNAICVECFLAARKVLVVKKSVLDSSVLAASASEVDESVVSSTTKSVVTKSEVEQSGVTVTSTSENEIEKEANQVEEMLKGLSLR